MTSNEATGVDLTFVCSHTVSSRVISWFSAGHLSHVDANLRDGTFLGSYECATGSIPAGVRIRPTGYYPFSRRVTFSIPATAQQRARWLAFLNAQLNKDYDWDAIWGFIFNRDWRDPDAWICSELQAAALEASGIVPRLYLAANKITPVALALAVSAIPGVVIRDDKPW